MLSLNLYSNLFFSGPPPRGPPLPTVPSIQPPMGPMRYDRPPLPRGIPQGMSIPPDMFLRPPPPIHMNRGPIPFRPPVNMMRALPPLPVSMPVSMPPLPPSKF